MKPRTGSTTACPSEALAVEISQKVVIRVSSWFTVSCIWIEKDLPSCLSSCPDRHSTLVCSLSVSCCTAWLDISCVAPGRKCVRAKSTAAWAQSHRIRVRCHFRFRACVVTVVPFEFTGVTAKEA